MPSRATAVLVLSAVLTGPAVAQHIEDDRIPLPQFEPGSRLRLETERRLIDGVFLRIEEAALVLSTTASEERVPVAALTGVWTRGRAVKTGAIAGAIAGGAFGVFVGAVTNAFCTSGFLDVVDPCPEAIPILGLGGGVLGGALGAGVGALIPRWHRRYP